MQRLRTLLCFFWFCRLLLGQWERLGASSNNLMRFGFEYGNIAEALVKNGAFADAMAPGSGPTAWMPPLLCWIYAGVFALFGCRSHYSMLVLILLKSVLLSLGLWIFLGMCGKRWGPRGMLVAAALTFIWPELDRHRVFEELDDTWFINFLGVCAVRTLCQRNSPDSRPDWPGNLFSLLLPLASPSLTLAYLVCLVTLALRERGQPARLKRLITPLLLVGLSCILWGARNQVSLGRFYPIKSNLWFDFVEANLWDDDGLLTDSFFAIMHPVNPNLIQEQYLELGEVGFIDMAHDQASQLSAAEWLRRCRLRCYNATLQLQSSADFQISFDLPAVDVRTLEGSRWVTRWGGYNYWLFCHRPGQASEKELSRLPLRYPGAVLESRRKALRAQKAAQSGIREHIWSYFFTLLPTLAALGLALRGRRGQSQEGLVILLLYATFLTPYVLVQHYSRYQVSVVWIQLFLVLSALRGPVAEDLSESS